MGPVENSFNELKPVREQPRAAAAGASDVRAEAVARADGVGVAKTEAGQMGVLDHVPERAAENSCEEVYQQAHGDMTKVRWADGKPNPMMVSWLNAEAPGLVRPGSRAVVVGCGLGDDVAELVNRGYDAVGFDVSPTAVSWARKRFPELAGAFAVADLLASPLKYRHRFDLVVEIYTLQSLDPARREQAASAVASLAGPQGHVLTICRGRDDSELLEGVQGPPWPLSPTELLGLMEASGLRPLRRLDDFMDDEGKPVRRLRGVFGRA